MKLEFDFEMNVYSCKTICKIVFAIPQENLIHSYGRYGEEMEGTYKKNLHNSFRLIKAKCANFEDENDCSISCHGQIFREDNPYSRTIEYKLVIEFDSMLNDFQLTYMREFDFGNCGELVKYPSFSYHEIDLPKIEPYTKIEPVNIKKEPYITEFEKTFNEMYKGGIEDKTFKTVK